MVNPRNFARRTWNTARSRTAHESILFVGGIGLCVWYVAIKGGHDSGVLVLIAGMLGLPLAAWRRPDDDPPDAPRPHRNGDHPRPRP